MADQTEVGVKAQVAYDSWIADMNEDELRAEPVSYTHLTLPTKA